jgi:hypothetical protein
MGGKARKRPEPVATFRGAPIYVDETASGRDPADFESTSDAYRCGYLAALCDVERLLDRHYPSVIGKRRCAYAFRALNRRLREECEEWLPDRDVINALRRSLP